MRSARSWDAIDRSLTRIARRNNRVTLRMLLPPFFATEIFVPRMADFCTAWPDIDIQVDTRDPAAGGASADDGYLGAAVRHPPAGRERYTAVQPVAGRGLCQ